ncbi:MAG TPA: hypothetical protein VFQ27_12850 [Xanthobacteraceae bacterium]|nr:hypothetical protein [Xanthobacteraceae bacterium]
MADVELLLCLAIGFATAGMCASGYQAFARKPLNFRLIERQARAAALMTVPLLVLAAPFIIMRTTLRLARVDRGSGLVVMVATVLAGFWSLMSGTAVAAGWVELVRLIG